MFDDLVGIPFRWGGRGPETFDCYGLIIECFRRQYGVNLPDFQSPDEKKSIIEQMAFTVTQVSAGIDDWKEVERQPGAAALISIRGYAAHIGFVLPHGKFLHTWERSGGVVKERLDAWSSRVVGYYTYTKG